MAVASGARGVVTAFGSFLVATALEDGAVQERWTYKKLASFGEGVWCAVIQHNPSTT